MKSVYNKKMKILDNSPVLAEIESRLNKYDYFSKNTLPGYPDARIFIILDDNKRFPQRKVSPNFYHWFILMKQFSLSAIHKWMRDQIYLDQEDSLITEFAKLYPLKKDSALEIPGCPFPLQGPLVPPDLTVIEIKLKTYKDEQVNNLRKIMEEFRAELTEEPITGGKLLRIGCRVEAARLDTFQEKISKCIQYDEFSVRRKEVRGQKGTAIQERYQ